MINLLSQDQKSEIRAGRVNVILLRYVILSGVAIAFLCLCIGFAYFILFASESSAKATIADNQQKSKAYEKTQKEAAEFKANLAAAKKILAARVDYTDLIIKVGQSMPPGTVLVSMTLDPVQNGKPVNMTAKSKSTESAVALKDSLIKSGLFSDVHFNSITNSAVEGNDKPSEYPYSIDLSVVFKKAGAN